jgi:hypothetical protein
MMIASSFSTRLFNSKVDIAPTRKELTKAFTFGSASTLGPIETTRVRFGIQEKILSSTGNAFPIITALSGTPFLQAKSNGKDVVIFGDAAGSPVAAIERVDNGKTFKILSIRDEIPIARVTQDGKVLNVTLEGASDPTYTIHKVVKHPSRHFPTKHIIKHHGKAVASTRYGQGNSYVLTVNAGADSILLTCLAAIADEIHC